MDQPVQPNRLASFFDDDKSHSSQEAKPLKKIKPTSEIEDDDYIEGLNYSDPNKEEDADDEEMNADEEAAFLTKEKVEIAKDNLAGLVEGRVLFVRDKTDPDRVYIVARFDDIFPDEINKMGGEMWPADIIIRLRGRGYSSPERTIKSIDSEIFKKKNWETRTE